MTEIFVAVESDGSQWISLDEMQEAGVSLKVLNAMVAGDWIAVPKEPTEAMARAGWRAKGAVFSGDANPRVAPSACYLAMIFAAQSEPDAAP